MISPPSSSPPFTPTIKAVPTVPGLEPEQNNEGATSMDEVYKGYTNELDGTVECNGIIVAPFGTVESIIIAV
jgi:hypothetical protein